MKQTTSIRVDPDLWIQSKNYANNHKVTISELLEWFLRWLFKADAYINVDEGTFRELVERLLREELAKNEA